MGSRTPLPAAPATPPTAPNGVRAALFARALAALDRHRLPRRDRIAIADFTPFSAELRLQIIDLHGGTLHEELVAHGTGSDPDHSGFLKRFSNLPGSNATSEGAYRTGRRYAGTHGMARRLTGLDPTNDNASRRAIVIHGAWYAEPDMIAKFGMLGRSNGCFAVGTAAIARVLAMLGPNRLLLAGKV